MERQLADHRLELRKARDQADAARGSVHDLRHQLDDAERRVLELGERLEREIAARVGAEERAAGAAVRPAGGQDPDRLVIDKAAVAGALASLTDAAGGLRELAGALEATANAFGAVPPPAFERSQFSGRGVARSRSTDRRRRTPLGIPGGLLE